MLAIAGLGFNLYSHVAAARFLPMILVFAGIAVVCVIIVNVLLVKKGMLFGTELADIGTRETDYVAFLEKLGATPLSSLILYLIGFLVALIPGSFALRMVIGASGSELTLMLLLFFSIVMTGGAFLYVLSDKLVLKYLLSGSLTFFPLSIREDRQKKKNFIIPMFMLIMTFIMTFSYILFLSLHLSETGANDGLIRYYITKFMPLFAVYLVVVIILMVIWTGNTSRLYASVIERMDKIVSGEKDLTGRVYISSVDEIASITGSINMFSDLLSKNLGQVKGLYNKLYGILDTLFASIQKSSTNISDIADKIAETMEIVEQEDKTVNLSIETGKELLADIAAIVGKSESQSASIRESAEGVQNMISSISSVTNSTNKVQSRIEELISVFGVGEENISKTISAVQTVAELSKNLMEINNLVASIASQTNLLAMNASIEAAHAGEKGKGFSVVADEIRKLAENTANNTKKSRENLKRIVQEIENTLRVSKTTGENFSVMKDAIASIESAARSISGQMNEQDRANKGILSSLTDTIKLTDEVQELTGRLTSQSDAMLSALDELNKESKQSLSNAHEMRAKNSAVKASMEEVTHLSEETSSLNKTMLELLNEFKFR